jgi:hypothetical protein
MFYIIDMAQDELVHLNFSSLEVKQHVEDFISLGVPVSLDEILLFKRIKLPESFNKTDRIIYI